MIKSLVYSPRPADLYNPGGMLGRGGARTKEVVVHDKANCPGKKLPILAIKRPAHPNKSAIQN
jgi:hypothetical protein